MRYILKKIKKIILDFLQVQCFLSLVSLPIIVAWGLPFSLMTIIGNFVFSPFIILFLLCSSLIFFTELLSIPNFYLISILTSVTQFWLYCLSFGSKKWLIGFPIQLLPFFLIVAAFAFFALQYKKFQKSIYYIYLSIVFILMISVVSLKNKKINELEIFCNNKKLLIINNNNKSLQIIDKGALGEKRNSSMWVSYILIPEIIKNFGFIEIDELVYFDQNKSTQKAIDTLSKEIIIKNIIKK